MTGPLAPRVCELLETKLDTFEKLEVVLALHASGRAWAPGELAQACRVAPETVSGLIDELVRDHMVDGPDDGGRMQLAPLGADQAFQELMALYAHDREPILSVLSARAVERIRGLAARAFAEAFAARR